MKKILSFLIAACMLTALAACSDKESSGSQETVASGSPASSETSPAPTRSAETGAETVAPAASEKNDGSDDDISLSPEDQPVRILARIIRKAQNGFEAEILTEFELDFFSPNQVQEVYYMRELRSRLSKGDKVTLRLEKNCVISREEISGTSRTYGAPDIGTLHAGTVVSAGVSRISADNEITCGSLSYGEIITEDSASYTEADYAEWEESAGSGLDPLEELPCVTARINEWVRAERDSFEFECFILNESVNSGYTVKKNDILFFPDSSGTACFGAPSEKDFPAGSTVKLYFAGSKLTPVCIERRTDL